MSLTSLLPCTSVLNFIIVFFFILLLFYFIFIFFGVIQVIRRAMTEIRSICAICVSDKKKFIAKSFSFYKMLSLESSMEISI